MEMIAYHDDSSEKPSPDCKSIADAVLAKVIDELKTMGFDRLEIALAVADAAEDYVIQLAQRKRCLFSQVAS
jgi:hypothetical protein